MRKNILLWLCAIVCSFAASAQQQDYEPQLRQLAGEIAAFTVGTSDATFESCEYDRPMITFVVNPQSKIGQYRLANPFEEQFYETMLSNMFSGNPQQGVQVMDFLIQTRTLFCFKIKPRGQNDYSETTVWPGNVKSLLELKLKE